MEGIWIPVVPQIEQEHRKYARNDEECYLPSYRLVLEDMLSALTSFPAANCNEKCVGAEQYSSVQHDSMKISR
jgi:hypothetical protein